jgi:hypothetical protein
LRPRTLIAAAATLVAAAAPGVAAAHSDKIDLTRVSGPSPFAAGCPGLAFDDTMIAGQELEPAITVNPAHPKNIVATWIQDSGPLSSRADLTASTLDGGRTWSRSTIPGLSKCTGGTADGGSDPWVSAGADGTVYFSGLGPHYVGGDEFASSILATRSTNGGRTWRVPVALRPPQVGNETPVIAGSPTRAGRVYMTWAEFATGDIRFSQSNDRGATWSAPVVMDASANAIDLAQKLLVLPNGSLVVVFARAEFDIGVGKVYATRSLDGGRTWRSPVEITSKPFGTVLDDHGEELPQPQYPSAAVAPDGTLYAAIEGNDTPSSGVAFVARSRDGGVTWRPVTPPGVGAYAFEPAVAVARDGTLGVTWYDLRNDRPGDGPLTADVWFARSRDRGATWRERHVAGPTDLRTGALARQNRVGEYQGLAAVGDHGFAAVLTLAGPFATDGPTDVFVARIDQSERHGRRR